MPLYVHKELVNVDCHAPRVDGTSLVLENGTPPEAQQAKLNDVDLIDNQLMIWDSGLNRTKSPIIDPLFILGTDGLGVPVSTEVLVEHFNTALLNYSRGESIESYLDEIDSDITNLQNFKLDATHEGTGGNTHLAATSAFAGFMSAPDKLKMDGIAQNANNYIHPSTHPANILNEGQMQAGSFDFAADSLSSLVEHSPIYIREYNRAGTFTLDKAPRLGWAAGISYEEGFIVYQDISFKFMTEALVSYAGVVCDDVKIYGAVKNASGSIILSQTGSVDRLHNYLYSDYPRKDENVTITQVWQFAADVFSVNTPAFSTQVANKAYVDGEISTHEASRNHPLANASLDGFLGHSHFSDLNNSTDQPTVNTLMKRDVNGRVEVADPSSLDLQDATNVGWVNENHKDWHTGHIYAGEVVGSQHNLPQGWTHSINGTGYYRVTHNLGTMNYAVVVTSHQGYANPRFVNVCFVSTNYFSVDCSDENGVLADSAFFFSLILFEDSRSIV